MTPPKAFRLSPSDENSAEHMLPSQTSLNDKAGVISHKDFNRRRPGPAGQIPQSIGLLAISRTPPLGAMMTWEVCHGKERASAPEPLQDRR